MAGSFCETVTDRKNGNSGRNCRPRFISCIQCIRLLHRNIVYCRWRCYHLKSFVMEAVFATERLKELLPSVHAFVMEELIPLEKDHQARPFKQTEKILE